VSPAPGGIAFFAAAALVVAATIAANVPFYGTADRNADIFFIFNDSRDVVEGRNPYARILDGDMRTNQKYPTYFPLFYLTSALTQWLGLRVFTEWLAFWRIVFAAFDVAIALLLLVVPWRRGLHLFAGFAALFWSWNRWTLFEILIAQIDFIPIFFLLLSLVLLERRLWLSLVLLGVSLAAKQIAIFLIPLYLIRVWQRAADDDRARLTALGLAAILAVPLLLSLPFLVWGAEAYLRSLLFSATRLPRSHFGASSVDAVFGLIGLSAKLPMLALMAIVYVHALRGRIGTAMAALLVMSVFVDFNSVLYTHYPCWVVPLLVLAACDHLAEREHSPPAPLVA
jgi:uncharacterized membrane protein